MIRFLTKYFFVILVVMFVHMLALVPWQLQGNERQAVPVTKEPVCTMAFADGPYALPEITSWAALISPSLFSRADYQNGFSAIISYAFPNRYTPKSSELPTLTFEPLVLMGAPNSSARITPMAPVDKLVGLRSTEPAKADRKEKLVAPKSIYWMWGDGCVISIPPKLNADLNALDLAGREAQSETRLTIVPGNGRYRLLLQVSCGIPELDELAIASLGVELSSIEGNNSRLMGRELSPEGERVRVDWRMSPIFDQEEEP